MSESKYKEGLTARSAPVLAERGGRSRGCEGEGDEGVEQHD